MPGDNHLSRGSAAPRGDLCDCGVLKEFATLAQGRPGLGQDPLGSTELPEFRLVEEWVQLDLVDRRNHACFFNQALQALFAEVGDADGLDASALLELNERLPSVHELVLLGLHPVD